MQEPVTTAPSSTHGGGQLQTGLGHCLLRRNHGELGEAVHQGDVLGGQVIFRDETFDVRGMFEAELLEIGWNLRCGCRRCRRRASARRRPE